MAIDLQNYKKNSSFPADEGYWEALEAVNENLGSSPVPTAPINLYVSTAGNDNNTGLTLGQAFRTIKRAIGEFHKRINPYYEVIINIADGDYSSEDALMLGISHGLCFSGSPPLKFKSISGNQDNVIIPTVLIYSGACSFHQLTINAGNRGTGVFCSYGGGATFEDLVLKGIIYNGIVIYAHGWVIIYNLHLKDSTIFPPFAVVYADMFGAADISGTMQTTNSTGRRYSSALNSVIQTYGQGPDYLPGTTAGSVSNGGIYA